MTIIEKSLNVGKVIVVFFVNVLGELIALLSSGTKGSTQDDCRGDLPGLYNYRTGKFDNGTDPYGWYEDDI